MPEDAISVNLYWDKICFEIILTVRYKYFEFKSELKIIDFDIDEDLYCL